MRWRKQTHLVILILAVAVIAIAIAGYIAQRTYMNEPILGPQRCGVGLPSCRSTRLPQGDKEGEEGRGQEEGIRCINGWCQSDRIH